MRKSYLLLLLVLSLTACQNADSIETIDIEDEYKTRFTYEKTNDTALELEQENRKMYSNKFLEDRIPDQWEGYGVGDPYVYRFNGKYYLYVSTKDHNVGVRAWVSDDMMNWTPVTGEGLTTGYVCEDETTVSAYAPEVIYRDGYFYMCQSSGGKGHYFYRSLKPEGPFERISENFGESIDGSFFIDDDENMYFLRAGDRGIVIKKFNDEMGFVDSKVIAASYMNGWTEGPYLLKRNGIYYLTHTGNHIMSNGYRVSYSYASEEEFRDGYTFNKGDVVLINTDKDFYGLGHSSTVLGPDLDSYYMAYHNLINRTPNRNFNLARLSFNGINMTADTCSVNNNYAPRMPIFYSDSKTGLTKTNNIYLSNVKSPSIYSAEFNFIGDNANLYFSYIDIENHHYINLNNNVISVYEVVDGNETLVKSVELNRAYDYSKLHTIRIAYNETLDIYFDNCLKISDLEINNQSGYIGYSDNVEIFYTALTDVAKGSSDAKEPHQNNISLEDYAYSNNQIKTSTGMYTGSKNIVLENANDTVAYPIYVNNSGKHNFDLLFKKEYAGKTVKFRIDNGDYIVSTLPDVKNTDSEYIKTTVFTENLTKGNHTLSITCVDKVEMSELSFYPINDKAPSNSYSLAEKGDLNYYTEWDIKNSGHLAKLTDRNVLYIPLENLTNAVIEVDVTLSITTSQTAACGVVLRADNAGLYTTENQTGIQGYFCGFNSFAVFISKYNYEFSSEFLCKETKLQKNNTTYHLKVTIVDNRIIFDFDNGTFVMEYNDPIKYGSGSFGIYADDANALFRNLKIYPIEVK